MLAELALAAARRSEQALGPGSAILVLGAALEGATGEARRTLLLAALGAATRAGDARAFESFRGEWARSGGGETERRGLSLVARLDSSGHADLARGLARAELERARSADALFALGALFENEGRHDDAAAALREAASLAGQGAHAARILRAGLRHAPPERADAVEDALATCSDVRDVLRLAPAALASPRLYARVRVLDRLVELAADRTTREAVLRIALAYADLCGGAIGPLERDRLVSIATRAGAPSQVLAALTGHARPSVDEAEARDALMGRPPRGHDTERGTTLALRTLASVVSEDASASLLLSALMVHPPGPAGWTTVLTALARPRARAAAIACAERWIDSGVAPPRGFSVLAEALARADAPALAERAWSEAIRAHEPGARARLGAALEARAREAHAAGDRVAAKALLERAIAVDPEG